MINESKRRGKKLEWLIYALALISFALMIVVIINNHETSVKSIEISDKGQSELAINNQSQKQNEGVIKENTGQKTEIIKKEEPQNPKIVENQENSEQINKETTEEKQQNNENTMELNKENSSTSLQKNTGIEKQEKSQSLTAKKPEKTAEIKTQKIKVTKKPIQKVKTIEKKQIEKKSTPIVQKPVKRYNWKTLKRYKSNPSRKLQVTLKYKVKAGDALWRIAKKFKVKTINIIAVNKRVKNPDKIFPGQVLLIPNK